MDISKINFSKNHFHSEDFVRYEKIDNNLCIMMNSDGNGSIGESSKIDIYQFDSCLYELGSTIAITTDYYSKKIFRNVVEHMKHNDFIVEDIYNCIKDSIDFIYREAHNVVHFCMLLTVLNFKNMKIYTFNIGNCGYSLVDLDTKHMTRNEIQCIKTLSFNGRGTALVGLPDFVHNDRMREKGTLELKILEMPKRFVFLQYSDGLDYDIAIPIVELEEKIRKTIDFDIYDFSNPSIIKNFSQLLREKIKKDGPDTEFSRYNLTRKEIKNIISRHNGSKNILIHIMKHIFAIDEKRRKIDDISICVLYYK